MLGTRKASEHGAALQRWPMVSTEKAITMTFAPQIAAIRGQPNRLRRNEEKAMSATNSVVAVYDSHDEAEHAIKALQQAGVDMKMSLDSGQRHTHR